MESICIIIIIMDVLSLLLLLPIIKPWPIMLNFLPIMLLSNAQKFACYNYAQYYAHDYCNYATVHTKLY